MQEISIIIVYLYKHAPTQVQMEQKSFYSGTEVQSPS